MHSGERTTPDHSHAAFIAAYGFSTLEADLLSAAQGWLEVAYGQSIVLKVNDTWQTPIRSDKRDYRARSYADDKRPRLHLVVHNHRSSENTYFDDYAVFDEHYRDWLEHQRDLTPAEREKFEARQAKRRAEEERRAAKREAARQEDERKTKEQAEQVARELKASITDFASLPEATKHPYLKRKELENHTWSDVRQDGENLAIAVRNVLTDEIIGLQYVAPNGDKWFKEGTPKKGSCIWLTGIPPKNAKRFVETEGWASAASCALAVQGRHPKVYVVAAIDAGNLEKVYKLLKRRWPRSRIVIASDDDAGTASELDKKGNPKPNTGQLKAHSLAFKVGCKVAIPRISGLNSKNVDFSDVYRVCGLEDVWQQLQGARNSNPNHANTDAVGKSFKHGYALAKKYDCTISVHSGRYLGHLDIKPGVTFMRDPMGTGKTEAVARWLAQQFEMSVFAMSHLQGLTGSLASRCMLTDYRDIPNGFERTQLQAAYCVNSLWRLVDNRTGQVQTFDVVFIDEIQQLLRRLTSRRDFARKRQCLEVLEHLVRSARYLILADAHLDELTLEWVRRLRPLDKPHMVLSKYIPGRDRRVYQYERRGDVRAFARDALKAGKRVYYATNGLERSYQVSGWLDDLKAEMPGLRTLLINSETANDEAVKAFFRDPSGESRKYDLIVVSPSVSTGVSIKAGHFDLVCGEFSARVGTPNDALQALARVRDCHEWHVWVDSRRAAKVTDAATIRAAFWREPGDDAEVSNGVDPETGALKIEVSYGLLYEQVKVAEAKAINAYARYFWELILEEGCTVCDGNAAEDAEAIEQHATETAKLIRKAGILGARDLTDAEAKTLRGAQQRTREDAMALERHDLISFYELAYPAEELEAVIDADRDGDLRRQIKNLELARALPETVDVMMQLERVRAEGLKHGVEHYDDRAKAYRTTLEAAKLDLKTLEPTGERYDDETLRETWLKPLKPTWHIYCVTVPGWPTIEYAGEQPMKALGSMLRGAFGLTQRRAGKASAGRYTVSDKPLEMRRDWVGKRKKAEQERKKAEEERKQQQERKNRKKKREQISIYSKNHNVASVPPSQGLFKDLGESNLCYPTYLKGLLETGQLAALGSKKCAVIARKITNGDTIWLDKLTRSRELGEVLGAAPPPTPLQGVGTA